MRLDFSQLPLKNKAFSEKPMTFFEPHPIKFLSAIFELTALETGNRKAREYWQATQLRNLLMHAAQRSAFWRERIGNRKISNITLSSLPILNRSEIIKQVESEGSLLVPGDKIRVNSHSTSGSSGMPVRFFVSAMNARYNEVRSTAQYFLEGRDLTLNRIRFRPEPISNPNGFKVVKTDSWLGVLGSFIRCGINKHIEYLDPNMDLLRKELECDKIGYLVAQPRIVEAMFQHIDPIFLKHAGMEMWIPLAETPDPKLREIFSSLSIPVRANYSAEEVGMIGTECEKIPENYHVATSNVLVEVSNDESIQIDDKRICRVLVTHLHSYATPFIRYDIGDFACLADRCACGHDGPTLSNIYGRKKTLLKRSDGKLLAFHVRGYEMANIAKFDEYRIRQTDLKTIVVEIGGREFLTPEETASFIKLIKMHAGDGFEVEVKAVTKIAWGHNIKRLGFHSEIL